MLSEYQGKKILSSLGIPVPEGKLAKDLAQAKQAAASLGYPVVLKAQSGQLPHKTEAGALILGIADDAALERAWTRLHDNVARARPGLALEGVLVEKMAAGGIEMVVGARRDPGWGPVLLVGLGGIWIEALQDVRILAPDLPEPRIVEEIHRLRGAALLRGLRGSASADIGALARVVARLGGLMRARPEVNEVDINPLVVYPQGVLALDALVVVSVPQ
jgi:succinyl-CoA synthetase beta subunit